MYVTLFAIALKFACPWLSNDQVNRHSNYIANTVNTDIEGGFMLIATGTIESGYRIDVERCECKANECDLGEAIGVYQLHSYWYGKHTKEEICKNSELGTRLAYKALVSMRARTDSRRALLLYVGRVSFDDKRVKPRIKLFNELINEVWNGGL